MIGVVDDCSVSAEGNCRDPQRHGCPSRRYFAAELHYGGDVVSNVRCIILHVKCFLACDMSCQSVSSS